MSQVERQDWLTPHYQDDVVTLHHGDCLDVLRTLPDHSVDAVVTDPPYGLGFMGKTWDSTFEASDMPMRRTPALDAVNAGASRQGGRQRASEDYQRRQARDARTYQEWCEQWARECLRVLKPGGHLLAFGGTRTAHRLASAIEDAGFELRDTIAWLYGSGFPKSLDVSKAIDKAAGADRPAVLVPTKPGNMPEQAGEIACGATGMTDVSPPATDDARTWQGWGTALKPAHEPIIVARKSPVGNVAANVLAYGTGALNIGGCRVGSAERFNPPAGNPVEGTVALGGGWREDLDGTTALGRWPTNVALDPAAAAELDAQTGTLTSGKVLPHHADNGKAAGTLGAFSGAPGRESYGDSGGASRFFPVFSPYWQGETCCMCNGTGRDAWYVTEPEADGIQRVVGRAENGLACRACNGHGRDPSDMPTFRYEAKAPTDERPRVGEVAHPTVKPLDLMRWLVRLVTPPGGLVLEPFAGSGTTAEACIVEGFRCIAIEREGDYLPLILARITKPIQPDMFGASA